MSSLKKKRLHVHDTVSLEPTTPRSRVSGSDYFSMRKLVCPSMKRVVNPGSDLVDDLLTPLNWYPGDYSIHYV